MSELWYRESVQYQQSNMVCIIRHHLPSSHKKEKAIANKNKLYSSTSTMKSRVIASIVPTILAFLPHAVDSAASVHPIVSCSFIHYPGSNFIRAEERLTWFDHNLKATQMGYTLASIINKEEQAQVEALYENNIDPNRTQIWMGAVKEQNGEWQWSDGSIFQYTNWNAKKTNTNSTRAYLMFPDYPDNKMKWKTSRTPNRKQAAVYRTYFDNIFEVCATSYQYTPSPTMIVVNETTGEQHPTYGGGWGFDYTIYKGSAKGLDVYNDANLIPQDAHTNITVYVDRNDDNTCTIHVKTAKMIDNGGSAIEDGVMCNSCLWCGEGSSSMYSADCTNIEHGRMVECEAVDDVYFPLTGAALLE